MSRSEKEEYGNNFHARSRKECESHPTPNVKVTSHYKAYIRLVVPLTKFQWIVPFNALDDRLQQDHHSIS